MEEEEKQLQEILREYEDIKGRYSQERFVELLREVQELYGCIPEDVQETVCKELGIKMTILRSILKFFPSLYSAKRHRIVLCVGPRCTAKDSLELTGVIEDEIRKKRAKKSGTLYTFATQNCMKQCRTSPNMTVDGKLYPAVTKKEIQKILKEL